jgi:hypothetical protein
MHPVRQVNALRQLAKSLMDLPSANAIARGWTKLHYLFRR